MSKRKKKVLVLRVNDKNGRAYYNGFQYPLKTRTWVEAPDWKPTKECGNGLHGFLYGEGDGRLANWKYDDLWYVLSVNEDELIILGEDKVKYKKGYVLYIGNRKDAADYIYKRTKGKKVIGGICVDNKNAISGYRGISLSEENSSSGKEGISITNGCKGASNSNDNGVSLATGLGSESNSLDYGISVTLYNGKSTSKNFGTSIGFEGCVVKSGLRGNIILQYYDPKSGFYRFATAFVDGIKIKPDTWYKVNDKGEFYEYNER